MRDFIVQKADEVDGLFEGATGEGWEFEHMQLTPGPIGFRTVMASLPEISIHWYRYGASLHVRESHQHDALFLTFVLSAQGQPIWYGLPFDRNMALLYFPNKEQDYVLPVGLRSVGLMLSRRLIERMGWRFSETSCHRVDPRRMRALVESCREATRAIRLGRSQDPETAEVIQERLAMRVEEFVEPWLEPVAPEADLSPSNLYRVTRTAIARMRDWPSDSRLDIRLLAEQVHVSPRTIHRYFRRLFDVGPYEYHLLMRLRAFREEISRSGVEPGGITWAASHCGFHHLSRLAEYYHKFYGELPRDTLRRMRRKTFAARQ